MRPLETTAALADFQGRGPGTDAERRAARWLARELKDEHQTTTIEPFWCRPNWALAHAWHVALALAGSLVSVSHATIGAAFLALALISLAADGVTGVSLGRRLTPERASQNVIATPATTRHDATTLIVTANYDAGRTALVYRDALRRPAAALRQRLRPMALGWLAWLALAIAWLLAVAVIRAAIHNPPHLLGILQLPPSVVLVLALALLLEAGAAGYGPAAGDNASGAAIAIALTRTLQTAPPRNLDVELVLQGAGEGQEIGLRKYLRGRGRNAIVLGIAASGHGTPTWWHSDGRLIPLRYARGLRELAKETAQDGARPHRGRGGTPALPARAEGMAAIAIGNLDGRGLAERSHQPNDTAGELDTAALDRALELGRLLVDAIDHELEAEDDPSRAAATPA